MDWSFDTLKETVLDKLLEIDNSNFKANTEPERVSYLISIIEGIRLRGDRVIKGEEDVTEKFINAIDNMITDPLSRVMLYSLEPISKDDLLVLNDGYNCKPIFIHPNSEFYKIIYNPSREEVGHVNISTAIDGSCNILFAELKGKNKTKLFLADVLSDAILDHLGNVPISYDKDFNGMVVKKYKVEAHDQSVYATPNPGFKHLGRYKNGQLRPEDPFYAL